LAWLGLVIFSSLGRAGEISSVDVALIKTNSTYLSVVLGQGFLFPRGSSLRR